MNRMRMGFMPTSGLARESHQWPAKEENLSTSEGLELVLADGEDDAADVEKS